MRDFRLLVKRAVDRSTLGVDLRFVEDGEQLLDYLRGRGPYAGGDAPRPGLVLLDLNLPRTDGRDALRAIKGDPALRTHPGRRLHHLERGRGRRPVLRPRRQRLRAQADGHASAGRPGVDDRPLLARPGRTAALSPLMPPPRGGGGPRESSRSTWCRRRAGPRRGCGRRGARRCARRRPGRGRCPRTIACPCSRSNGLKIFSACAGSTPMPLSATRSSQMTSSTSPRGAGPARDDDARRHARAAELDGVADQVLQQLPHLQAIGLDRGQRTDVDGAAALGRARGSGRRPLPGRPRPSCTVANGSPLARTRASASRPSMSAVIRDTAALMRAT